MAGEPKTECSALRSTQLNQPPALYSAACANGFHVTAGCFGRTTRLPQCMDEKWCGRLYDKSGGKPPEHARQASIARSFAPSSTMEG